jgi:hypothetical protein
VEEERYKKDPVARNTIWLNEKNDQKFIIFYPPACAKSTLSTLLLRVLKK